MPSFTSTSIVVITRQIDIDENMLVSDANTVLSKLLEYRSTVKDVNSFVDTEINKIISSYIDKTKKDKLSKIQKQLKNIEKYNKEMSNKINELSFVNYINISNIEEMQNTFYTRYLDLKEKAEYLDMGNEDLNSLVKYVQILEVDVVNFSYYIDLVYDDIDDIDNVSNDNILEMLTNIQNKMQNQIEYVTKYKDTSYYYETFNVSKEEDMVKYNTTSDDILNNMNQSLEAVSIYIEQVKNRTENSNEMNQLESNMSAKNSTIVSEVNRIYKDFLEKELDYIKDNIELLNSENTNNLELISKYTTIDIAQYINYTYKTLQESIDDIQNKCNENSNVCLENTINSYIKINTKLLKTNIDITKIYNDNISKYSNLDRSTK